MFSLKIKLIALYIGLVFMVMIVSSTYILFTVRNNESNKAKQNLTQYCTFVENEVIKKSTSQGDLKDNLDGLFKNSNTEEVTPTLDYQIAILTKDGSNVIASTELLKNTAIPVIISAINSTSSFQAWRKDKDTRGFDREWFEYATPTRDYIIYARTDASNSSESVFSMAQTLFISVVIALVLTAILGYLLSETITTPITELTKKAKELASGNLDEEVKVYSTDEIGQLTDSFNFMTKELKHNIESIETEKNKFEVILHSMSDGVIAYDSFGNVIHVNNASNELLNINASRYNLQKLMSYFNLDFKLLNKDATISVEDRYITINVNHYMDYSDNTTGTLIVIQDITKHKKLDNMRKEFVANVSHELRTPLTTVKSYTETIIDNEITDKETIKNFLSIVISEVDRMTYLVEDLLDLSRFDNGKMNLKLMQLDLAELLEDAAIQNEVIAGNKNQIINYNHNGSKFIKGDKGRLLQVFNNIISNAVKYSPENSEIFITIDEDEKYYIVAIKDNGIGIPKSDINRIFERFFRVDKARSRAMGGVGLGLSITKEIVDSHKGKISATSNKGDGTTVIVKLLKI
ncbi:MAG: ATP-binding protein [Lachnospirales bacterium]